jgi:hypothetical protein
VLLANRSAYDFSAGDFMIAYLCSNASRFWHAHDLLQRGPLLWDALVAVWL